MNKRTRQPGFTLIEILIVVTIAALMMAVAMPNIPGMIRDNKLSGAKNLIKTALDQAQSYAASHSKYAGIRFQKARNGDTYLVLIEHEPQFECNTSAIGNLTTIQSVKNPNRFVAIPGAKPRALPGGISVIDGVIANGNDSVLFDYINSTGMNPGINCIENYQTFSIIFSPTGQLVTKQVTVYPRYDSQIKTMVGFFGVRQNVNDPLVHSGAQYSSELDDSYDFDVVYPADSIFTSMLYCYPALYNREFGADLDPYLVNNPDGLLSYDAHYIPELGGYSSAVQAYATAPWCGNSSTITVFGSGYPISYDCYSEPSATGFFLYDDKAMESASPNGDTRYTNFFSAYVDQGMISGCEYFLLNRYTGDFFAN